MIRLFFVGLILPYKKQRDSGTLYRPAQKKIPQPHTATERVSNMIGPRVHKPLTAPLRSHQSRAQSQQEYKAPPQPHPNLHRLRNGCPYKTKSKNMDTSSSESRNSSPLDWSRACPELARRPVQGPKDQTVQQEWQIYDQSYSNEKKERKIWEHPRSSLPLNPLLKISKDEQIDFSSAKTNAADRPIYKFIRVSFWGIRFTKCIYSKNGNDFYDTRPRVHHDT